MPLEFVTPSGAPFKMDGAPRPKKVAKPKKVPEDFHKGFVATGFSSEHLRTAEVSHAKRRADALRLHADGNTHVRVPPPWNLDHYLRNAKPPRGGRPFGSRQAAEDLGAMLRKSGWVNVCVMELKRDYDR